MGKKCAIEGCETHSVFNFLGEKTGLRCSKHKLAGMIDVVNKKCAYDGGCSKQPTFNFKEKTTGLYCSIHKHEGLRTVTS
jgi:EsV-1-7 cysteine-rich motif